MLRGVDLGVRPGEFVTLLGPSGCGKTTLLRILAGLEIADGGKVVLDGEDLTDRPAHRRPVNTVFQSYALFPHLSVRENVAFGLRSRRVEEAEVAVRVRAALDLLRIGELADRPPGRLSGGQRQRAALARALVNEPALPLVRFLTAEMDLTVRLLARQPGPTRSGDAPTAAMLDAVDRLAAAWPGEMPAAR